jgi:hypothetical protein
VRDVAMFRGLRPWYLLSASVVALVLVTLSGASSRPSPCRAALGARGDSSSAKAGDIEH